MSTMTFFFIFVSFIAILFLVINFFFSVSNAYDEKDSPFECGFLSFNQTRKEFEVYFYSFGILFMLLESEVFTVTPYSVVGEPVGFYGLSGVFTFVIIITAGFFYEIGKGALNPLNKQNLKTDISSYKIPNKGLNTFDSFGLSSGNYSLLPLILIRLTHNSSDSKNKKKKNEILNLSRFFSK